MEDLHAHSGAPETFTGAGHLPRPPTQRRLVQRGPRNGAGSWRSREAAAPRRGSPHVLLVDVGSPLREQLVAPFTAEGMLVTTMDSPADLAVHVGRLEPHALLLGLQRQGKVTLELCARLREQGRDVPVILLSASRDEVDCVVGLESGADDYVVLPCSPRELLARVRAVLRRCGPAPNAAVPQPEARPVAVGDSVFDPDRRSLSRGAELRHLNPIEYAILAELLLHPAQPISRQRLLEVSHGTGKTPLPRSIDTAVMRLRRLVEPQPSQPVYLQTLHGHGYMFLPTGRRGV
ncbi:winged helix-turn-helix domain-containing protein [Ramlibacter sp. MMS24-I3-19]|uniref:winged helix-turn-helix domain-containing protein n=1 Tax=Ramlibacter sp. MMS24-I3-19 TaxID=3416606 RepID=UPI003CFD93BC